jgi:hypothetical protein
LSTASNAANPAAFAAGSGSRTSTEPGGTTGATPAAPPANPPAIASTSPHDGSARTPCPRHSSAKARGTPTTTGLFATDVPVGRTTSRPGASDCTTKSHNDESGIHTSGCDGAPNAAPCPSNVAACAESAALTSARTHFPPTARRSPAIRSAARTTTDLISGATPTRNVTTLSLEHSAPFPPAAPTTADIPILATNTTPTTNATTRPRRRTTPPPKSSASPASGFPGPGGTVGPAGAGELASGGTALCSTCAPVLFRPGNPSTDDVSLDGDGGDCAFLRCEPADPAEGRFRSGGAGARRRPDLVESERNTNINRAADHAPLSAVLAVCRCAARPDPAGASCRPRCRPDPADVVPGTRASGGSEKS